jgi:hypothetical protein
MKLLIAADIHGNYDLRSLPMQERAVRDGVRFHLIHATPSEPIYGRLPADSVRSFRYPVAAKVAKLRALGLPPLVEAELVSILETGSV